MPKYTRATVFRTPRALPRTRHGRACEERTTSLLVRNRCLTTASPAPPKDTRHALLQVRDVASTYVQVWEVVGELLAELDVLASFADVATSSRPPFVRPEMLGAEEGEITLVGSRHPCLELQDGVDVIANDCEMKRCTSWFQLVTGPNMGGKSTYIRQVCFPTFGRLCAARCRCLARAPAKCAAQRWQRCCSPADQMESQYSREGCSGGKARLSNSVNGPHMVK